MQLLPGRRKSVDQHDCVHFSEKQLNVSVLLTRGLHPLLPICAQSLVHSYTCGCFFFFFAIPLSMWDLSSPARGSKCLLQWKLSILTTRPPGNPLICILNTCLLISTMCKGRTRSVLVSETETVLGVRKHTLKRSTDMRWVSLVKYEVMVMGKFPVYRHLGVSLQGDVTSAPIWCWKTVWSRQREQHAPWTMKISQNMKFSSAGCHPEMMWGCRSTYS